jgi:bifunctional non-homologous end joining protein LigD
MNLIKYRKKRDFNHTSEPRGKKSKSRQWKYVIQKHAASHLHYDFRLELDGVLKSWAVPKGPSLDPRQKRLAVEVEDHPIEYADFEGVIPEPQYGAGTVMVWDRGFWTPDDDPHKGLRQGMLKFHLQGEKLRGGWVLVKSKPMAGKNMWLLIKHRDDEGINSDKPDILDQLPLSVATGRDMDEIAAEKNPHERRKASAKSHKNRKSKKADELPANSASAATNKESSKRAKTKAGNKRHTETNKSALNLNLKYLPGARRAKLPKMLKPQLATRVAQAPDGDQWWHETKYDGYRIACRKHGNKVELLSRNMQSWTDRLPHLVEAARDPPVYQAFFDGEVVAMRKNGATNFQNLQSVFQSNRVSRLLYYVFDLIYLDGYDRTKVPLYKRNEILAAVLPDKKTIRQPIRYAMHIVGQGPQVYKEACRRNMEGIICKNSQSLYMAGRTHNWLKVKCINQEEFVVGGYTNPKGSRRDFGALLMGYYKDGKKLVYAGRVGTGFSRQTLQNLIDRLKPLERKSSPFGVIPDRGIADKGTHWVKPSLVAQVHFIDWTRDGLLRQPSFMGLREDKPAAEVIRG